MMKEFYYHVAGETFYDTVAFGKAWKQAVEVAKTEHTIIERTIVKGGKKQIFQFYAKGAFLDEDYFKGKVEPMVF